MAVVNLQNGSSLDGERLGNPAYRGNWLSTSWAGEGLARVSKITRHSFGSSFQSILKFGFGLKNMLMHIF